MAGFDLASILSSISDLQGVMRGDQGKAEKTVEDTQALRVEQLGAAETLISLSTDQARMEGEQKLQMQDRLKATAKAFGTDILDPNNRIAYLAREQNAAVDEAIYNSKRASTLRDTQLFDSPLDYLMARPFAAENDAAAAEATKRATVIDKAIDDLNSQTQATVQTQTAINTTFTEEQAANQLQLVALTAADKVRTLKMNQNTAYLADLKILRDMTGEQIRLSTDGYKLSLHEKEYRERMAAMAEDRATRKEKKKDEKVSLEEYMGMYNAGAKLLGKQQFTDPVQFTAIAKYNKDMINSTAEFGMSHAAIPGTADVNYIGRSAGESVLTLASLGGKLPASAEKVSSFLDATRLEGTKKATDKSPTRKATGDQVASEINTIVYGATVTDEKGNKKSVAGAASQMMKNAEASSPYGDQVKNIYRAPDVDTVLAITPRLTEEKWWNELVVNAAGAAGAGGKSSPTADQMFNQAILAVSSKSLTPEEAAAGISTYFKAATRANITNEQYERVGLPIPKGYNAAIGIGKGLLGGKTVRVIDTLDESKVKLLLMSELSRRSFGTVDSYYQGQ